MTEYPPAARFRDTVLRTWLSVGLIFAILMGLQGGLWLPTGDPARDSAPIS